jgi:predicted nucleic acid-binding protein
MTREGLTVTRLYDEKNAPWAALVQQLPANLIEAFIALSKSININIVKVDPVSASVKKSII